MKIHKKHDSKSIDELIASGDLSGRHFRGADLRNVDFGTANVKGVDFQDADLSGSDLSRVLNLEIARLDGADLRKAKLPEGFVFSRLLLIEGLIKNCRGSLLYVILACIYVLLTIAATTDGGLLANATSSMLPFVQAPMSIYGFYEFVPVVILVLYVFFHLNLQRLWEAITRLPAAFPDGSTIDEAVYPWLINSVVRVYSRRLKNDVTNLDLIICIITNAVNYFVVPFILCLVWYRCLCRHDVFLTALHVFYAAFSIWLSIVFYRTARPTLSRCVQAGAPIKPRHKIMGFLRKRLTDVMISLAAGVIILFVSFLAIGPGRYTGRVSNWINANADVSGESISKRPDGWTGSTLDECRAIDGASLQNLDMRNLRGNHVFLANADLRGSNLSGADLTYADLRGAILEPTEASKLPIRMARSNLSFSNFRWASLTRADMNSIKAEWANLSDIQASNCDLMNADLRSCLMQKAMLSQSDMRNADLEFADLSGAMMQCVDLSTADLGPSNLTGANIGNSRLVGTDLGGARLMNAMLFGDDLTDAILSGAMLNKSNLTDARLANAILIAADLRNANLTRTDFTNANLYGAKLQGAKGLTQTALDGAYTSGDTIVSPPLVVHPRPLPVEQWNRIMSIQLAKSKSSDWLSNEPPDAYSPTSINWFRLNVDRNADKN